MPLADMSLGMMLRMQRRASDPPLSPDTIGSFVRQIASGLNHAHQRGVAHRDLKPDNILLRKTQSHNILHAPTPASHTLWLSDWGMSRQTSGHWPTALSPDIITLWYRPLEILLGAPVYSPAAVDMWSLGCIMAELCCGVPLFCGTSQIDQIYVIFRLRGTPSQTHYLSRMPDYKPCFPVWPARDLSVLCKSLTQDGLDLLDKLLCYDPRARITAAQVLQHPFCKAI
jgi:serine/threonine protein kinase